MPDHRFPLQMECLALAVQSTGPLALSSNDPDKETQLVLRRATAFLGWAQSTTPTTRERNKALLPRAFFEPPGDSTESPAR